MFGAGYPVIAELTLPAKMEHLEALVEFVRRCAGEQQFAEKQARQVELATEEALVNVIHYAYPKESPGLVTVRCGMSTAARFVVEIKDQGIPFHPEDVKAPDLTAGIAERRIGGLGIYLMRKMVDEVLYRREGDTNILTLTVCRRGNKVPVPQGGL